MQTDKNGFGGCVGMIAAIVLMVSLSLLILSNLVEMSRLRTERGKPIPVLQLPKNVDITVHGEVATLEKEIVYVVTFVKGEKTEIRTVVDEYHLPNSLPKKFIVTERNGILVKQKVE